MDNNTGSSFDESAESYNESVLARSGNIIAESDAESSSSGRNSAVASAASSIMSGDSGGEVGVTRSIVKAIRRSIHQFSRGSSDEEAIQNSDDSASSDDSAPIIGGTKSKSNRRMVIDDDTSEEEYAPSPEESRRPIRTSSKNSSEKHIQRRPRDRSYDPSNNDESDEESDSSANDSRSLIEDADSSAVEPSIGHKFAHHNKNSSLEDVEIVDVPAKKHVVHVLSSSDDDEGRDDEDSETSLAMSMAKAETMNTTIDPMAAQQRALLVYKQQRIQTQLAKARMIFKTGNMDSLPDRGERLRLSIAEHERELREVNRELTTVKMESISTSPPLEPVKRAALFKADSLEVDPTYLKPTTDMDLALGRKATETLEREQALTVERLKDLHGSILARPAEDARAQDPRGLKVPLMPHQQHALAWLLWRERQKPPGGVLADDMGLGKTLTMISLVMASIAKRDAGDDSDDEDNWQSSARAIKNLGGTLVVAPASLLAQWEAEVNNRCKRGILSVELYHGNNRESVPKRLAKNDIVVTTYNLLSRQFKTNGTLYKIRWRRVILDEAHVIRNHKSQTSEAVCGLEANKRWALTGTPIHNKEMDLFALLKFLRCSPFDDVRVWKRWVDNKNSAGHERLATVMKSLMLRRTKAELQSKGELDSMPDKSIEVVGVVLDPEERLVYDKVMVFSRTLFAQFLAQRAEKHHMFELGAGKYDKPSYMVTHKDTQFTKAQNKLLSLHADVKSHEILVLLLRLRQVCCHPSLINAMLDQEDVETTGLEDGGTDIDLLSKMNAMNLKSENEEIEENEGDDIGVDKRITQHLLTSENPVFDAKRQSSKMRAVLAKVEEIMEKGDKMIIVSQWTGVLHVVANELDTIKGASYRMFTGQVAVKDRQGIMDEFNSSRPKPNILLLSLTAGGVGLNLVGANHLLLIDIHWNPQLESQAQDRIYRFGQKKNVFIYKYICEDTIEERIKGLQERKLELAKSVLSGGGAVVGSKLSLEDIKSLFSI